MLMCRVKYEQTVGDIKAAVARKTGIQADKQQLFWHQKELTSAYNDKTLLEMHLHTGFSLKGYDLVRSMLSVSLRIHMCCFNEALLLHYETSLATLMPMRCICSNAWLIAALRAAILGYPYAQRLPS